MSATGAGGGIGPEDIGTRVAPPSGATTVVATDSNSWLGRESNGPRATAALLAVGPDGRLTYYNGTHTRYWDVDPVPGTAATVEYVAADHLPRSQCGQEVCTRNVVERANLTTGETTRVYARITPGKHSTRWHDVDRVDEDHLVVADIARDRVYVVNTTSGLVTWSWEVQSDYRPTETGGPYPGDWTHLNDVEVLDDGRIVASLRNQDQVVFLDRQRGLIENWTLGSEDDYAVLYEQHNPDYIPAERGGPSLLVADSENHRIVEYHRAGDGWNRTWTWRDAQLQWPRDADRLPDGHTLVTDSNGDRVIEVARDGDVVWTLDVAFPYEAERLGTGDESTGGSAAGRAGLQSRVATRSESQGFDPVAVVAGAVRSTAAINAVLYVMPAWVGYAELGLLAVVALVGLCWLAIELYWASWPAGAAALRERWQR
ncbi:MAG: aryl-sulfate sulfotransferase [Haloarculaceae archaeon]